MKIAASVSESWVPELLLPCVVETNSEADELELVLELPLALVPVVHQVEVAVPEVPQVSPCPI